MASLENVFRLFVAMLLCGLVGFEREWQGRPAGFRTHILVGLGSALTMIIGLEMARANPGSSIDPQRIAANVVSGLGFLGAGTIMREGASIRGLTTAASLWVCGVIGIAAGAGSYVSAAGTSVLALLTLVLMSAVERRVLHARRDRALRLQIVDRPGELGRMGAALGSLGVDIRNIRILGREDEGHMDVELIVRLPSGQSVSAVLSALTDVDAVCSVEEEE